MNLSTRFVFAVIASLSFGCAFERVKLPDPPPADAPIEARIDAYEKLAPTSGQRTLTFQNGQQVGDHIDYLLLGGGYRVWDPADLLPVVGEDSATAKYVHAYEERQGTINGMMWATVGMYGGGTALGVAGLGMFLAGASNSTLALIGLGTAALGGVVFIAAVIPLMIAAFMGSAQQADRNSAFLTYDDSLKTRLKLHERDLLEEKRKREQGPATVQPQIDARLLPPHLRPPGLSLILKATRGARG